MIGTATDRFMSKVDWPAAFGACWHWRAYRHPDGYGRFKVGGQMVYAHRAAYELFVGLIPTGLHIDHLCRNRGCVNPLHLEPVPKIVNDLRGESPQARNARKTHCDNGHGFSAENTYVYRNRRCCRACNREAVRRLKQRRLAVAS